jgi:hypothetical protein
MQTEYPIEPVQPGPSINITNSNVVNIPRQSRGSGTVLMFVFFWWALLMWWAVLASAWLVWLLIAGIVSIFKHDFFARTWYQPWPAWMFGIR